MDVLDRNGEVIELGHLIKSDQFNGEPYTAIYVVVVDPNDMQMCLLMIKGNEKSMKSTGYSSFGNMNKGRIKGVIIGRAF